MFLILLSFSPPAQILPVIYIVHSIQLTTKSMCFNLACLQQPHIDLLF